MSRLLLICLLLPPCLVRASEAVDSSDSLYEAHHARKPEAEEQAVLGPKSGGIRYDARMLRAARIAMSRAYPHPTWRCWHYVKDALIAAQVIDSRPSSPWAKQAGEELCRRYGFKKLERVHNPMQAPVGAVLVYGGPDAGHVEIRTDEGFVSDFVSRTPYPRPFLGAYVKPS